MSKSTITAESKTILKNMLITVTTTIIGATALYFLGFNSKKSGPTKLEREEATVDAWKTYVTIENIYAKNGTSLLRDAMQLGSFKAIYEENVKESEKFQNSLKDLINDEDLDRDMHSMLERRLENEKTQLPLGGKLYLDLDSLIDTSYENDWQPQRLTDSITSCLARFGTFTKGMMERSLTELEDLSKTLSERYDHPFNVDEFFVIQVYKYGKDPFSLLSEGKKDEIKPVKSGEERPEEPVVKLDNKYLLGKWDASGASIEFTGDGKLSWYVPSNKTEAKGTWKLEKNLLQMDVVNVKNGKTTVWEFSFSEMEQNSFSIILIKEPFNKYNLVRK